MTRFESLAASLVEFLRTVLDQMIETDPRVASLKPEQFIDARFFQELDKEEFIQKLWK